MARSMWLDEEGATDWVLSHETGLQEIDAFYDNEQQREELPFAAEKSGEDEFSSLMEDIEQLTKARSHNVTNTTSNTKPHSLASPGDSNDAQLSDAQQHEVATGVANIPQLTPIDADHGIAPQLPLRSSVNSASMSLQQESTILPAAPHFPQYLTSTGLPEQSEPLQSAGLPDLSEALRLTSNDVPTSEVKMTPPKGNNELPPSSEGKSSLMDEMRSEETRYPGKLENAKVDESRTESRIQLPGIATEDAEKFELPGEDAQKPNNVNPRKSSANLGTRLRSAAVPQKKTAKLASEDNSQPGAKDGSSRKGPLTRGRTMTRPKQQDADEAMFPDGPIESANEELSVPNSGKKRKQNAREDGTEIDDSDVPSNVAKKPKPALQQAGSHTLAPNAGSMGVANYRPPRNSLGQNEMRKLTESAFLADRTPQSAIPAKRQTRAQKEEEAKKAPNAGRAAKERHRGKGPVQ